MNQHFTDTRLLIGNAQLQADAAISSMRTLDRLVVCDGLLGEDGTLDTDAFHTFMAGIMDTVKEASDSAAKALSTGTSEPSGMPCQEEDARDVHVLFDAMSHPLTVAYREVMRAQMRATDAMGIARRLKPIDRKALDVELSHTDLLVGKLNDIALDIDEAERLADEQVDGWLSFMDETDEDERNTCSICGEHKDVECDFDPSPIISDPTKMCCAGCFNRYVVPMRKAVESGNAEELLSIADVMGLDCCTDLALAGITKGKFSI